MDAVGSERDRTGAAMPRTAVTPLAKIERQAQRDAAPQPADVDVKLAMIDFGMTARLSTTLREHVVALLMDIADNRGDDAAERLIEMGEQLPGFDRATYVARVAALMARNYDLAVGEMQAGKVLYELINISYQRVLRLPAELTLLAKTLFNLDAVTRAIDPTFSPIPTIREYRQRDRAGAREARPESAPPVPARDAGQRPADGAAAPARSHHASAWRRTSSSCASRCRSCVELMRGMQKVANRVFSGLVLAGLLVASANGRVGTR